jgi:hypothetical protein
MAIPASTWTANDILVKVRNITATPISSTGASALTNNQIYDYINKYYAFTMPFELKEQINQQAINFTTVANTDVYPVLGGFSTDEPMAYANGFPLVFYQDRDIFFQDWPQQYTQDQVASGDGVTVTFAGTTQAFPVINQTYYITDGTQILADTGVLNNPAVPNVFNLTGNGNGTINTVTGAFSATFTNAPSLSAVIYDNYQAYQPARPQGVLFYNNQFTFRPIPDLVYQITMQGFITQVQLAATGNSPLLTEWGELIAIGASLDIFLDRGDLGAYGTYYPILKRYENVALGRFVEQLQNQQSVPRF